ncbi:MAG: hypothetical protein KF690_03525 [Bacteroidetes bacterium]|nr:hypothetical protein [Bacteroidota bacterium]
MRFPFLGLLMGGLLFGWAPLRAQTVGGHLAIGPAMQLGTLAPTPEAAALYHKLNVTRTTGVAFFAGVNFTAFLPNGLWLQPEFNFHVSTDQTQVKASGDPANNLPAHATYTQLNSYAGTEFAMSLRWRPYWRNDVLPYAMIGPFYQMSSGSARTIATADGQQLSIPKGNNGQVRYGRLGLLAEGGLQFSVVPKFWSIHVGVRAHYAFATTFMASHGPSLAWAGSLDRQRDVSPALHQNLRQLWVVGLFGVNKHFGCY